MIQQIIVVKAPCVWWWWGERGATCLLKPASTPRSRPSAKMTWVNAEMSVFVMYGCVITCNILHPCGPFLDGCLPQTVAYCKWEGQRLPEKEAYALSYYIHREGNPQQPYCPYPVASLWLGPGHNQIKMYTTYSVAHWLPSLTKSDCKVTDSNTQQASCHNVNFENLYPALSLSPCKFITVYKAD